MDVNASNVAIQVWGALRIAKILQKRKGPDPGLKQNPSSWYSLGSYIRLQRLQTNAKGKAFSMSSFVGCLFHTKFHQCCGGRQENISESILSSRMEIQYCLRDLEDERLGFKLMGGGGFLRQSSPSAERLRNDWFVGCIMFYSRLHLEQEDQIQK
jgi:hypothetical protein